MSSRPSDYKHYPCPKCNGSTRSLGYKTMGVHLWHVYQCRKCKHEFPIKPGGLT